MKITCTGGGHPIKIYIISVHSAISSKSSSPIGLFWIFLASATNCNQSLRIVISSMTAEMRKKCWLKGRTIAPIIVVIERKQSK